MKKVLVVLSLVCFVAVNAINAQTPAPAGSTAKESKKEASATPTATASKDTPAAHPSCCQKGATAKSCCKAGGEAKACTPEEKAKCAEKMKADASPKPEAKPQTN